MEPVSTLTVTIPRIKTPRLLLREYRLADFERFAAHHSDAEAMQHLGGVVERRTAWRQFANSMGSWVLTGNGWWAVEHQVTATVVGMVGAFTREGFPDLELGWVLYREHWRNGYATEAAHAALMFSLGVSPSIRVVAHVDAPNRASRAVCERLQMTHEGTTLLYDTPVERYAR
jgi:RimJ/RimL family protein N-acetyltransferase